MKYYINHCIHEHEYIYITEVSKDLIKKGLIFDLVEDRLLSDNNKIWSDYKEPLPKFSSVVSSECCKSYKLKDEKIINGLLSKDRVVIHMMIELIKQKYGLD